ncbi:DUF779 domain-containing protein [Acinetobacter baumannii]
MVERVVASEESKKAVELLKEQYGDLIFFQSSGCCEGSTPMCYPKNEYAISPNDIQIGFVRSVPYFMSKSQYEYMKHTQLILELEVGNNNTFSLNAPDGRSFVTKSRLFTDEEWSALVVALPELA